MRRSSRQWTTGASGSLRCVYLTKDFSSQMDCNYNDPDFTSITDMLDREKEKNNFQVILTVLLRNN